MSPSTPSSRPRIPFQQNPFTGLAVASPWTDFPVDVESINDDAFQLVQRALRQTRLGSDPISILVTGEPGSGKTHLLSRLKRHLETEADAERAWYVYVRSNASAQTLWRHLQRCLANDLLQPGSDGRPRLVESVRADSSRVGQIKHLGVSRALENLASGRHALTATAWLRGEPLAEADLAALGIGAEKEDEDRSLETEAKLVVEALLSFLSPAPVVICFDQVEALETYPGEEAGYHALAQMISALVSGEHRKLLLISCVVAAFEHKLERLTNEADRDRWLQEKATLMRIKWEPAAELVKCRLDSAPSLKASREQHAQNPLWPLDEHPIRELFSQTGRCLPRKLIHACKVEFDRQMGDVAVGPKVSREEFLRQEYRRILTTARLESRKAGGEKVLEDCLPWLLQNSGSAVMGKSTIGPNYANLSYRSSAGEAALMFCYAPGNSFTSRLKKAAQYWNGIPHLRILSDPAIQPKPGSKGAQYLEQLKRKGARQIHPLPEALAALQAIRNLTASARAGELSLDGETVSEQDAANWALANLEPQVGALRDELIIRVDEAERPVDDLTKTRLLSLLSRKKLLEAEAAANELSLPTEEVTSCARRNPLHFGLLEGPPLVVFEAVDGSEPETAGA